MRKTIEVVYEDGVFKPLEKVEIKRGRKAKVIIERGVLTLENIKEIEESVKVLPKVRINPQKLDELYYEGKIFY